MLRLTIFGLVATFLSLVAAIPTKSLGESIEKRGSYNKYVGPKPKHYKHRKHHGYPPGYTTPTPSATPCPTGKPFYIQASANSKYAILNPEVDVAADAFQIIFDEATEELATVFTFTQSNGVCQLGLFPTESLPSTLGFGSFVIDYSSDSFNSDHYLYIIGPVGPTDLVEREAECEISDSSELMCSVDDPTGGPPQNVLQLYTDSTLIISQNLDFTASTFTLIPATGL